MSELTSRYDLIKCMGRGGFGVVFKAKDKLSGGEYAIKGISLPNKEESRMRVLREVVALESCAHTNIVRYFHSWLEQSPPEWQEKEDNKWMADEMPTSMQNETTSESHSVLTGHSQMEPMASTSCSSEYGDNNGVGSLDEDDDSCIVFRSESQSMALPEYDISNRLQDLAINISCGESNNNCPEFLPVGNSANPVQNKAFLYIKMELCTEKTLRDWIQNKSKNMAVSYIYNNYLQIVDAVVYIHNKGLIHRDLKPSNIFFSQRGEIKIGDFGLATKADLQNLFTKCGDKTGMPSCARHTMQVGTLLYMSPEQLKGKPYDFKVDIYSLGLILFEMIANFDTEMERITTLQKLRDGIYPEDFGKQDRRQYNLLQNMLSVKPEERPSAMELKEHPALWLEERFAGEIGQWLYNVFNRKTALEMLYQSNKTS